MSLAALWTNAIKPDLNTKDKYRSRSIGDQTIVVKL